MKKVLFTLPALAFTLFLTFCQKAEVQEEASPANAESKVTERGTCTLEFYTLGNTALGICGITINNTLPCAGCGTATSGREALNGFASFTVTSPLSFFVKNNSGVDEYVRVALPGTVGTGWVLVSAGGGCEVFYVDDSCNITHI